MERLMMRIGRRDSGELPIRFKGIIGVLWKPVKGHMARKVPSTSILKSNMLSFMKNLTLAEMTISMKTPNSAKVSTVETAEKKSNEVISKVN